MSSGSLVNAGVVVEGTDVAETELDAAASASLPISVSLRSWTKLTLPSSQLTHKRSKPVEIHFKLILTFSISATLLTTTEASLFYSFLPLSQNGIVLREKLAL